MESSAAAHRGSFSDSLVKLINSFKELLTAVFGAVKTPLTIAVIVIVSLVAFRDYERWNHRDLGPARAHELALTKTRDASTLALAIVSACRSRPTALWTCVGATRRQLTK